MSPPPGMIEFDHLREVTLMAMGRGKKRQRSIWIETSALAKVPGHPFYERLSGLLAKHGFETFSHDLCKPFYAETQGRPSIAPDVYFKSLLLGYA